MNTPTLDEDTLQEIYTWIDEIPLSRPKRNITRDFSDGGMYTTVSLSSLCVQAIFLFVYLLIVSIKMILVTITSAPHPRTPRRFVKYTNFQTHEKVFP